MADKADNRYDRIQCGGGRWFFTPMHSPRKPFNYKAWFWWEDILNPATGEMYTFHDSRYPRVENEWASFYSEGKEEVLDEYSQ